MEHLSYEAAFQALQDLTQRIQNGDMSVDELEAGLKEADALFAYCQDKLRRIEGQLDAAAPDMA